jgi:uncharacterized protein YndB with AHSA1/START domain
MKRDIRLQFDLPHPPHAVWRALTEPRLIEQWMMPTTFEPKVGHRFEMRDKPRPGWNGIVESQVLELEPERRLSYTWERGQGEKVPTTVTFTLEPSPSGTRLKVDHKNFQGLSAVALSFVLAGGWKKMVNQRLTKVLNTMHG